MKYRLKYRWYYNTLDEDVGISTGVAEKVFDSQSDDDARVFARQYCEEENPASLRRSYEFISLVRIEKEEEITKII